MRATFYRRLWRFNAFVIAGVGLSIIVVAAFVVAMMVESRQRQARLEAEDLEHQAPPFEMADPPAFTELKPLAGTNWLALTVTADSDDETRNILLIDQGSGFSRHVLPDNDRRLVRWFVLPDERLGRPARAYVALVETAAATSEPRTTGVDVLLGNLETGRQAWVARGVTAAEQPHLVGDEGIGMLVWQGDRLIFRRYNLHSLREELSRPVPVRSVPKAARSL